MQDLTRREYEVAELAASGYSNKQIGDRLNISEQTVKNHMHSVFRKLSLSNRVELTIRITRRTRSLPNGRVKVSGGRG
jgi:two-component system, NarL family, response regulator DegU